MKIRAWWGKISNEYEGVIKVEGFCNDPKHPCVYVTLKDGYSFACDWFEVI